MILRHFQHTLRLRRQFTLATSSRAETPDIIVEIEHNGLTGYGEASMPPYLGESYESAESFLAGMDMTRYDSPLQVDEILHDIDAARPGNTAIKAAIDIAIHDWIGKQMGRPWYRMWGFDVTAIPRTSFTIGAGDAEHIRAGVTDAAEYPVLKVKLGRDNDQQTIQTIRDLTDKPIRVDVNQGWRDRDDALRAIEWLATQNVELVEQPLPKERIDDLAWLTQRSPLPIIGDEGVQRLADVRPARGVYHGINVKLMKCAGMREAHAMMMQARSLGLKVMLGCMTETTCAISAAAHLSPLADWVDLDGAALIANDIFDGATLSDGRMRPCDRPGIGAVLKVRSG